MGPRWRHSQVEIAAVLYPTHNHSLRSSSRPRSSLGAWLRRILVVLLLAITLPAGGLFLYRDQINSQLVSMVEKALNQRLDGSGWNAHTEYISWNTNGELRIGRISFLLQGESVPAVTIGPIVFRKTHWQQILDFDFAPDFVRFEQTRTSVDLAHCDADSLKRLMKAIGPREPPKILPVFEGSECQLMITNTNLDSIRARLVFDISLNSNSSLDDLGRRKLTLNVSGRSSDCHGLSADFSIWPDQKFISGNVRVNGLELSQQDLVAATSIFQLTTAEGMLRGLKAIDSTTDFRFDFSIDDFSGTPLQWSLSGRVRDGSAAGGALPGLLSSTSCDFQIDPSLIQLTGIRGQLDNSPFEGRIEAATSGLGDPLLSNWSLNGSVRDLDFGKITGHQLPEILRKLHSDFLPTGTADLMFDVQQAGGRMTKRTVHAAIKDMGFVYHKFPYPLDHCVGTARLEGDEFRFNIQTLQSGQMIDIGGWVRDPGAKSTYEIRFGCTGSIPIDEKLFESLSQYTQLSAQVRDLRPRGLFGFKGSLGKSQPESSPNLSYEIDVREAYIRHTRFDYPLRDVSGKIRVVNNHADFIGWRGVNNGAIASLSGSWNPQAGLNLTSVVENVDLDGQLRIALPPAAREVWDQMRPAGRIDVIRTGISSGGDLSKPLELTVECETAVPANPLDPGLTVRPAQFPWTIGRIATRGGLKGDRFWIENFRGEHDRSWLTLSAEGSFSSDSWQLILRQLTAGAVDIDRNLLDALPKKLTEALRSISLTGSVQIAGDLVFSGSRSTPLDDNSTIGLVSYAPGIGKGQSWEVDTSWNVEIDIAEGTANAGLPVRNLSGSLVLQGEQRSGVTRSTGDLRLDAFSIYDAWIHDFSGPVLIDDQRVSLGMFAADELTGQRENRSARGTMFDGRIQVDAQAWNEDGGKFYVQAMMKDGQIRSAVGCLDREICAAGGFVDCELRCGGRVADIESVVGDGELRLTQASLYELPVMMGVLKSLTRRNADRTAFDTGTVQFGLRGNQIDLNRIELNGDALSLVGNGVMDWSHRIRLDFYTVAGRNRLYIPLLSELYKASSQQILWITVDGSISSPRIAQEILPGINEGLRRLLEPPAE